MILYLSLIGSLYLCVSAPFQQQCTNSGGSRALPGVGRPQPEHGGAHTVRLWPQVHPLLLHKHHLVPLALFCISARIFVCVSLSQSNFWTSEPSGQGYRFQQYWQTAMVVMEPTHTQITSVFQTFPREGSTTGKSFSSHFKTVQMGLHSSGRGCKSFHQEGGVN